MMIAAVVTSMSSMIYAGTPISQSELPKTAVEFLNKHFPGDNVRKAEKEQSRRGMEYEVDLTSGAEVEFLNNGDWKEVKAAKGNAVPAAIVPEAIAKYVAGNYAGQTIKEISRRRAGFEIELSNGKELKLTTDAKPMPERQGRNHGNHGGKRGSSHR